MRTSVPVVQVDDPPSLSHQLEGVPVAVHVTDTSQEQMQLTKFQTK